MNYNKKVCELQNKTVEDFRWAFYVEGKTGKRKPIDPSAKEACLAGKFLAGRTDCFLSMYRFPDEWYEYYKTNDESTANYSGDVYSPAIVFDIDRGDLREALKDTRRLVGCILGDIDSLGEYLEDCPVVAVVDESEHKIVADSGDRILIYFSGNKGFHVELLQSRPFDDVRPRIVPQEYYKLGALWVAQKAEVEIDSTIYDRQRLFRAPNTIHGKTGLYKVLLTPNELFSLNIEQIKQLATAPRKVIISDITGTLEIYDSTGKVCKKLHSNFGIDIYLGEMVFEAVQKTVDTNTLHNTGKSYCTIQDYSATEFTCNMQELSDGSTVPRIRHDTLKYIYYGEKEGNRSNRLFNAVCDCVRCGWNREAVYSLFVDVARSTGLPRRQVENQIERALNFEGGEKSGK